MLMQVACFQEAVQRKKPSNSLQASTSQSTTHSFMMLLLQTLQLLLFKEESTVFLRLHHQIS
jgi:hypothetical protein